MSILESVISGIVQGATEFLPISSSGHLVILHTIFGYKEPKVLEDVLFHFSTLFAVIIFFRKDIAGLFKDKKKILLIITGSIPVALAGFFFYETIERLFVNVKVVGIALLVTGVWILLGSFTSRNARGETQKSKLSLWHALLIGIGQTIALIPGISRSGATISTALLLKWDRKEAFTFSFLLSVPAILGAVLYKMKDLLLVGLVDVGTLACGGAVACIVGIAALWFLKKVLLGGKLYYFSIYCWIAGLIILFI